MIYISNKIIISDEKYLYDILGNKVEFNNENVNEYVIASSSYKHDILREKMLDHQKSSLILKKDKNRTFKKYYDNLLQHMQSLEMFFLQYLLKRELSEKDYSFLVDLIDLEDGVRDGKVSSKQYDEKIKSFDKLDKDSLNAFMIYSNISQLDNIILDELCHAECRIIDCMNSQINNIFDHKKLNKIKNDAEMIHYTVYSDNAGWCIQDAIKALSKSLDVTSKLSYYLNDIDNIKIKIPAKYFTDMKYLTEKWVDNQAKKTFQEIFEQLNLLVLIRNEFTHNNSLFSSRQPVYVGKGTECINNKPLVYSDMLFWDNDGNNYERANKRIGFFKMQLNAISETHFFYEKCLDILNCVLVQMLKNIRQALMDNNLKHPYIWKYNEVTCCDILKQIDINSYKPEFD